MKTQPATSVASAPSGGMTNWHDLDWAKVQQSVRKTQLKIAQATRDSDWRRVKRLQRMLAHSFYGRCMAVRRVTENRGRKTPGVDGETWGTPQAKFHAVGRLSKKRGYRPDRYGGYGYRNLASRRNAHWVSRRCWIGPCRRCICKRWSLSWKAPAIRNPMDFARIAPQLMRW